MNSHPSAQAKQRAGAPRETFTPLLTISEEDIPAVLKPAIKARVREVHQRIRAATERYGLYPQTVSKRRLLSTRLPVLAIDVTECTSRHLRAYGAVPEDEKGPLDESMKQLEKLVSELSRLVSSGSSSGGHNAG